MDRPLFDGSVPGDIDAEPFPAPEETHAYDRSSRGLPPAQHPAHDEPAAVGAPAAQSLPPLETAPPRTFRKLYLQLNFKFYIALAVATAWMALSVWLAQPWQRDLAELTTPVTSFLIIAFIAYVPGFMNAFLISSLLLDKRPPRAVLAHHPAVTMLIPAYNEEENIVRTLGDVAKLHYEGPLEIIVIDDGSTDATAARVREAMATLDLPDNFGIHLVDFGKNQGKAGALNSGLELATHDLICTIDADTRPLPEALYQIVGRYLADPPGTQAVAGAVLVGNGDASMLAGAQLWDYFHGIAAVKRMQSMYHGTLVAQGAFSLYRKQAIQAVGGWPPMVGEDIGLTWAMLKKGYRVGYAEDAVVLTNVPVTLAQFARQRKRWARGMIEALEMHEGLLLKRRLSMVFIWWNMLFLPMDVTYSFIFIPGLILALFGVYWIAGPMTLAVLPLAVLWNVVIYKIQSKMVHRQGLKIGGNTRGLIFYALLYSIVMQPICVWGYASELFHMRKKWETK